MSTREEGKEKREHDARKQYHKTCRKIIAYQIDEYKQNNPCDYNHHVGHSVPTFAFIVDVFRSELQSLFAMKKLPAVMLEYTHVGSMFKLFHKAVGRLKIEDKQSNLKKAHLETMKNHYNLSIDDYNLVLKYLSNEFHKLFAKEKL